MEIYDLRDEQGRLYAFEIPNHRIGRRGVCRVIGRIPGAEVLRRPKLLSWLREEEFCEFRLGGVRFVAWEPYGDNSRYWIGPQTRTSAAPELSAIRAAFARFG